MTTRTGTPGHPRIAGTRARGAGASTGVPGRRSEVRPSAPPRLRTPGDDMGGWVQQGACRTSEPELFFPVTPAGYTRSMLQIEAAKAVCRQCPVVESCLAWALAHPRMSEYGVWGAMSEEERRVARRRGARRA